MQHKSIVNGKERVEIEIYQKVEKILM